MNRDEFVHALKAAFSHRDEVSAVVLDGSMARGSSDEHSDVDLE